MSAPPAAPERHARNPFADCRVFLSHSARSGGNHARSRHCFVRSGGNSIYRPMFCARRRWRGSIRWGRGRRHRQCGRSDGHRRWNSQPARHHGPGSAAGSGDRANQSRSSAECPRTFDGDDAVRHFADRTAARLCLEPSPAARAGRSTRRSKPGPTRSRNWTRRSIASSRSVGVVKPALVRSGALLLPDPGCCA